MDEFDEGWFWFCGVMLCLMITFLTIGELLNSPFWWDCLMTLYIMVWVILIVIEHNKLEDRRCKRRNINER